METILVVGATGNIGVSAIKAALNTGRNVLAVVRSQASTNKLFRHVGTSQCLTIAEADVTSPDGIRSVIQRVRAGQLPSFQHVYSSVGTFDLTSPITELSTEAFRRAMNVNLEANFFAYRATIPYLLEQNYAKSTWTLMTGAAGESGWAGVTAISQGALFSLSNVACRELANTNVRFNEVFLTFRVDHDEVAAQKGGASIGSSELAPHYEQILARPEISYFTQFLVSRCDTSHINPMTVLATTNPHTVVSLLLTRVVKILAPDFIGKIMATSWKIIVKDRPLQLVSVTDIGWFGAQAFLNPSQYSGRNISLAGDTLSFEDGNKVFRDKIGKDMPLTFELVDRGILWASDELGSMFRWFNEVGCGADIEALGESHPKLMRFGDWLETKSRWV